MSTAKIGDIVVIKDNTCDHKFEIGEIVRIKSLDENGKVFKAEKLNGIENWCVEEKELKKATMKDLTERIRKLQ